MNLSDAFVVIPAEQLFKLISDAVEEGNSRQSPPVVVAPEKLDTVREACLFLGISKTTLYAEINAGHLVPRQLARNRVRFLRSDLLEYVNKKHTAKRHPP